MPTPELKPRYVATFRAGAPETIIVALLTMLGAILAIWFAAIVREFDCSNEADSECSTQGLIQLLIAIVGGFTAFAMLFESLRPGRGRPWRWFVRTAVVYAVWGSSFSAWLG
jgi:uncharacterized BrkB/YihY/UPF0761 family membrane protein